MIKNLRLFGIIVLLINAIAGTYIGYELLSDPSGAGLNFSQEWLSDSGFRNFMPVGAILLAFVGVSSFVILLLSLFNNKYYPDLFIMQGGIIIGWFTVEIMVLKEFIPVIHYPFYVAGVLLVITGISSINLIRKENQ